MKFWRIPFSLYKITSIPTPSLAELSISDTLLDPISASKKIEADLAAINVGSSPDQLDPIITTLKEIYQAISTIFSLSELQTLNTNMSTFNSHLQTKADDLPAFKTQWDRMKDLCIEINIAIATQELKLPHHDNGPLLKRIQKLLLQLTHKLDKFSLEELTHINQEIAALQNQVKNLDGAIKKEFQAEIKAINTKIGEINTELNRLAEKELEHDVHQFYGQYNDFLVGADNFYTLLESLAGLNWANCKNQIIWVFGSLFNSKTLPKTAQLITALQKGDPNIKVPAKPKEAAALWAFMAQVVQKHGVYTIAFTSGTQNFRVLCSKVCLKAADSKQALLAYLKQAEQLIQDIMVAQAFMPRYLAVRPVMGENIHAPDNFVAGVDIAAARSFPDFLTPDFLQADSPYWPGKKVCETTVLFYTPESSLRDYADPLPGSPTFHEIVYTNSMIDIFAIGIGPPQNFSLTVPNQWVLATSNLVERVAPGWECATASQAVLANALFFKRAPGGWQKQKQLINYSTYRLENPCAVKFSDYYQSAQLVYVTRDRNEPEPGNDSAQPGFNWPPPPTLFTKKGPSPSGRTWLYLVRYTG